MPMPDRGGARRLIRRPRAGSSKIGRTCCGPSSRHLGPGHELPGLSHRTGHGIGLDGHEPVNLVHGETQLLEPGMCFSDEPGLYIPGQFGVRLEDCFHMTEVGPVWFSQPPESLERPV
jgi:Xaa-Pro dipeptidase